MWLCATIWYTIVHVYIAYCLLQEIRLIVIVGSECTVVCRCMTMMLVIILVSLLLLILVSGSTAQEDPLCTDSYVEFESASVGSNDSGRDIRNQLYKAFYAPNQHLPYSVLVTYQLVLTNGTRVNLSSDLDCSRELWAWLSFPTLLVGDTTYLNRLLLFTLNYFSEWHPPHITITTTTAPCPDKIKDFLSEMTASVSMCIMMIDWLCWQYILMYIERKLLFYKINIATCTVL